MQTLVTLLEHGFLKGFKGEDGRWKVLLEAAEAAAALAATLPGTEPRASQSQRQSPPAAAAPAPEPPARQPPPAAASRPAMHAAPPPAPEVQPEQPPMLRQPAPSVAEPEPPRVPPAAEPPRPLPAVETPPRPTVAEKLLADQVDYLKAQLDRRDQTIVDKDALIAELMQSLARLGRTAIKRIGGSAADDELHQEFERSRRQQAEVNERHERVLDGVSDVLSSVRNHLARQRPTGTDNN